MMTGLPGETDEKSLKTAISKRNVFPCFSGSALKMEGVEKLVEFMKKFEAENA